MARALLIHPWIHDFAAHDFWLKPLGLLKLAEFLRGHGVAVEVIDCLNAHHKAVTGSRSNRRAMGAGKFYKEEIPKPAALAAVARRYSRYGIPPGVFDAALRRCTKPDAVLLTTGMTYWYPGVRETVVHIRRYFPDIPVVLGGIYATLCPEHARRCCGADRVISGGDWAMIREALADLLPLPEDRPAHDHRPAWDLLPGADAVVVRTAGGCPFHCLYCAAKILAPTFRARRPAEVVAEISRAVDQTGVRDVAFYDDALLWRKESHFLPILDGLKALSPTIRYHCPNGLHARYIDDKLARRLFDSGFQTIRLGLESSRTNFHDRLGPKLRPAEFSEAVAALRKAGFVRQQIGAYVMAGLPLQTPAEVRETIDFVLAAGARPHLAEYSPIPGTALWPEAVRTSPFDLDAEPLFHNNTLLPCQSDRFAYEGLLKLKIYLKDRLTALND
jgi:radical SAM superfamily enzyme YgiQ (UPF0313 family)